jgi:O-acetyl-ADP-ribose deacetylase (regulator of RNase III)
MIHEVTGDILLTRAKATAHGVAPNDNFGQGLALALRERWPAMYKDFRHWMHQSHPKVGELWAWAGADGHRLIALFTQAESGGRGGHAGPASVPNVNHALRALRKLVDAEKPESLAVPRLATGVGGLDWDDVRPLVNKHLGDLDIPVYVYGTYKAGVEAEEPS